jgi:uncharacterized protein (TIGR02266 family)
MSKWVAPTPEEQAEMRAAVAAEQRALDEEEENRRKSLRLALHANVTMRSETNFFSAMTENISDGGVFVATLSPPDIGEKVKLQISVEGEGGIVVSGIVRWLRSSEDGYSGCGIQFENLSPEGKRAVDTLVSSIERDPLLADF